MATDSGEPKHTPRRIPRRYLKLGALAAGILLALWAFVHFASQGSADVDLGSPTFAVKRGPLQISVLEGGSIEALESQEIRSEVKGYQGVKILSIVEEGYRVTEEDVKDKKLLVELDSSELEEKLKSQKIQIESTAASLIEAQKSYEIQINQNESDIQTAALEAKFARMDLAKYLGGELTEEIVEEARVEELVAAAEPSPSSASPVEASENDDSAPSAGSEQVAASVEAASGGTEQVVLAEAPAEPSTPPTPESGTGESLKVTMELSAGPHAASLDFGEYASVELLGDGEARQKLRELEDKLLVSQEEQSLAETEFDATQRLVEKDFETQRELEKDRLAVEKGRISVAAAETAVNLFVNYEFPKEAEKLFSDYVEKLRKLQRTRKEAESKLAQAEAKLRSAEARYDIESQQVKELEEQIEKCVIAAERPGLVVYGGNDRWYNQERIQEGATVRERQMILTIPDMTTMSVKVKVHESDVKKVATGQKAIVRVDAFPDRELEGEVIKVGVLPDAEQRWMNPDLKVYETSVRIEGVYDWLKPGMSAETEILVETIEDVLYVPVQAVQASGEERVCYVTESGGPRRQVVETGAFTEKFIEIKDGLEEGSVVLLVPPEGTEPQPGVDAPEVQKSTEDEPSLTADSDGAAPPTT